MKPIYISIILLLVTFFSVVYYPDVTPTELNHAFNEKTHPSIDVVFVLDTTGSMSEVIHTAKENIWSIVSSMTSAQPVPELRLGLVAYRDRGEKYITRRVDLSHDLDSIYAELMDYEAMGGGDTPEDVNEALNVAVNQMSWDKTNNTYKVIFLVGDAEPHMDYANKPKYPDIIHVANQKNITINTIQIGDQQQTAFHWQSIATLSQGRYFQVEHTETSIALATPFDQEIADLSKQLDETRIYYGKPSIRKHNNKKRKITEKIYRHASASALAKRLEFNTSVSGIRNFTGENELIQDIESGKIQLDDLVAEQLPQSLASMSETQRTQSIKGTMEKRQKLEEHLRKLSRERQEFIQKQVKNTAENSYSLDNKIYQTVVEQTKELGLIYHDLTPKY